MNHRAGSLISLSVSPKAVLIVGLGLLGLAAAAAVLYGTRLGPWAHSDGAGYVMLARNILEGRGLGLMRASGEFQPLSMHPPLYPLALVTFGLAGVELLPAARWLDAALFATTIILVGIIIYYASRIAWLAVAASTVIFATPAYVTMYTGALSEPLYFALSLGSLLILLIYFQSGRRSALAVAAFLAGLSVVTRYLGLAFVGTGFLGVLVFGRMDLRKRAIDSAVFIGLAALPSLLWFAWVNAQDNSAAARQWIWDLSGLWSRSQPIRGGLVAEFWDWIPFAGATASVPYRFQVGILAIVGAILAAIFLISACRLRREATIQLRRHPAWQLISVMGAFSVIYVAALSGVYLFGQPPLDAADIDQRILTPIYLALLLAAFALVPLVRKAWPEVRWAMVAPVLAVALALAWFVPRSWREVRRLHDTSAGLTTQAWISSETMQIASTLPGAIPIITNESTALMLHLDRPSYDVPELLRAEPQEIALRFGEGQSGEERIFREQGAALILFDSVYWQLRGVYGERADARQGSMVEGLDLFADLSDGAIYFYPQP